MSEQITNDIVEQARREIAARKDQAVEERSRSDAPWRYLFAGMTLTLLAALLLWPGTPLNWKMYAVVHGVCAQVHNVDLGGMQLPLCARNTGIYTSYLVTTLYMLALGRARAAKLPPLPVTITLALFVVIMAVDGFNSLLRDLFMPHLYTPRNDLRTLTGIGLGAALAVAMLVIMNLSLRKDADTEQRALSGWLELGGALLANLLLLAAIYGDVAALYWPIAVMAWLGIIGVLFCVNLLVAALAMRYEGTVTRVWQLARPASVALVVTLLMLGTMSYARFWLEAQGLVL
ncbi:MAG: hypothetical protein RLZZ387_1995 [Chloroflexota bacterium]|jgi:uncharacterized membrane protein